MKKHFFIPLLMVFILFTSSLSPVMAEPVSSLENTSIPLYAYIYDPCGGCASADPGCRECLQVLQTVETLGQLFKEEIKDHKVHIVVRNILHQNYMEEYQETFKAFQVEEELYQRVPQYFIGQPEYGEVVIGVGQEDFLVEAFHKVYNQTPKEEKNSAKKESIIQRADAIETIEPNDSVLLYFYKENCPYCVELDPLFSALPSQIPLHKGTESSLRFIAIDKNDPKGLEMIQQYYELLKIPEDRQYVPMIIIGEKDLFLKEEIVPMLLPALFQGEGEKTPLSFLYQ